ncbi:MAG: hypothetical protein WD278_00490 [Pirellulales bacterium]
MSTESANELQAFRRFLDEQIESGRLDLSPEESLRLWQQQRRDLDESVAAVQRALAEMDAGETGKPLAEFADEFRRRNSITRDA